MRVCSSLLVFGTGGEPGLRLGGTLVVHGASGVGGGLADNELLSAPLGNELPPGRAHLLGAVDPDHLPGKPTPKGFPGSLRPGGLLRSHKQERKAFPLLLGLGWCDLPTPLLGVHLSIRTHVF